MSTVQLIKKLEINAVGHSFNDIFFVIIPLLMPFLQSEFHLNYFQLGLILSGHIAIRSLFSYVTGVLGDKYQKNTMISMGFFLISLNLALIFWVTQLRIIVFLLIFLAVGVAPFHPLVTMIVGENAHPKQRALQLGLFESFGLLGIVLISFTFGLMVQFLGWRATLLFIAFPGLPLGFVYLKKRFHPVSKISRNEESNGFISKYYLIYFIFTSQITTIGLNIFMAFLPSFVIEVLGVNPSVASWYSSLYFLGIMVGTVSFGLLVDRLHWNNLLVISSCYLVAIPIICIVSSSYNSVLVGLLVAFIGIITGGSFNIQNVWLINSSSPIIRSRIFGLRFLITGFSETISPSIYGWIGDQFGLQIAYRWSIVPVVVGLLFILALYRMDVKDRLITMPG